MKTGKKLEIGVIRGDGVGPEMTDSALMVLEAVCRRFGHQLKPYFVPACGESIEAFQDPLPEESLNICRGLPAVLFGNTGLRKYQSLPLEKRPEAALMKLRKGMHVTTNIRPVKYYPSLYSFSPLKKQVLSKGLDFVFVRDIVGGVLCSDKVRSEGEGGKEAYEYEYYNEKIVSQTAVIAFEMAGKRGRKVANLDKSNVLESSRLWRQTIETVGSRYPDVTLEHYYIDNAAMRILESPWKFDVIVTSNLFGDIISDEGTQMTGTPYLYGSAELSPDGRGIYTPNQLHHPDESIIGKNVVNPIGMIMAAAMMLRYTFGLEEEAAVMEQAVERALERGNATADILEEGKTPISTSEMAREIARRSEC